MFKAILYEQVGEVAVISLNNPSKLNALDYNTLKEILQVLDLVVDDDNVGSVLLRGEGKAFSSGFDIAADVEEEKSGIDAWKRWTEWMDADARRDRLYNFPKPIVCEIKGYCLGAGYELASLCDILIASDDARIGVTELKLGLTPLARTLYFCNNIHYAKEFLMTGDIFSAQDAHRMGVVNKVVPREELEKESMRIAKRLARLPGGQMRLIKRLCNQALGLQGFNAMNGWGSDIGLMAMLVPPKTRIKFNAMAEEQGIKAAFKWMNDYFDGAIDE